MTLKYDHLIGRPFLAGKHDCFGLCREFYRDNFGIEIADYARPTDWLSDEIDLIGLLHERAGFEMISDWKIKDTRPGDTLCLSIGQSNPNHFAVVVDDNQIIHHLTNRLSTIEIFRDFWRNCTAYILRHPDVPDLRPPVVEFDIIEALNARYGIQTIQEPDGSGDA